MSLFHSILSQLQEKISKETLQTERIAALLSSIIGATVTKDQIVMQNSVLIIKASPTLKMAISLNKGKILAALKEADYKIIDIR